MKPASAGSRCISKVMCGSEENVTISDYRHIMPSVDGTEAKHTV